MVRSKPLEHGGFLRGSSIPFDYRSYVLFGYTILACGVRVPTRFRIDTRSPTLLLDEGIWQIDGVLYYPFSPEALDRLGVSPETARPFSWISNVPIETVEEPPYLEGQVLHSRVPPTPYQPFRPSLRPDDLPPSVSMHMAPRRQVGGGLLTSFQLDADETVRWSCRAWKTGSTADGLLVVTDRRILFCPALADLPLEIRPIELRVREATDVRRERIPDSHSAGSSKMGVRLVLAFDRGELFVVDDAVEAIDQLAKVITPIGG